MPDYFAALQIDDKRQRTCYSKSRHSVDSLVKLFPKDNINYGILT
jgi:hypothetical protein